RVLFRSIMARSPGPSPRRRAGRSATSRSASTPPDRRSKEPASLPSAPNGCSASTGSSARGSARPSRPTPRWSSGGRPSRSRALPETTPSAGGDGGRRVGLSESLADPHRGRMPHSHADEGQQLVDDVRRGHQGAALAPVVRTLADGGLAGGIIYDALAARAAAKTRA